MSQKSDTKKPWYKTWWAIAIFAFFILAAIASFGEEPNNPEMSSNEQTRENQGETVVFDVESLYGKNIDEISAILGPATVDTEPEDLQVNIQSEDQLAKEWDKTWEKGGHELLVTYNVASREVIDFFVPTNDPSGLTKDTKKLEEILNVRDSKNFTVEPIRALKDTTSYTGIKVVQKN